MYIVSHNCDSWFFLMEWRGRTCWRRRKRKRKKKDRERTTHHLKSKCERTNEQASKNRDFSFRRTHIALLYLKLCSFFSIYSFLIFSVESRWIYIGDVNNIIPDNLRIVYHTSLYFSLLSFSLSLSFPIAYLAPCHCIYILCFIIECNKDRRSI